MEPSEEDLKALGKSIREARTARGLSQDELAKATRLGIKTIGRLELGKSYSPRTAGIVQSFLRIGPYAPKSDSRPGDPPLSEATFPELIAALTHRYGVDIRAARAGGGELFAETERTLPPDVKIPDGPTTAAEN